MTTLEWVTFARRGRPVVVLISVEDLESIEETLFWQSRPDLPANIATARAEAAAGTLWDEAAVRRRYQHRPLSWVGGLSSPAIPTFNEVPEAVTVVRIAHRSGFYRPR